MNTAIPKKQEFIRILKVDALLLVTATLVPTMSHMVALPLYRLNPMLLMLMVSMLIVKNRHNAYLLAVLLPTVSCMVSGMPTPANAFCMAMELISATAIYTLLEKKSEFGSPISAFGAVVAAAVVGKCVFYGIKSLVIGSSQVINTPIATQILSCIAIAMTFAFLWKLNVNRNGR